MTASGSQAATTGTNKATGRFLAFGELMLRLSPPGHATLSQAANFDIWLSGAEANVATQLARLGHRVGFISRVPDNALGHRAIDTLRGHGVDTSGIALGGERLGLCFVAPGAGARATEVTYDRAYSSFAEAAREAWDWERLLDGADRLHLSGITPALGTEAAEAAIAAAEAAARHGVAVSFDGNWRGKLWSRRAGDPATLLRRIVVHADLMFGNHRDIALLLGGDFAPGSQAAADAAFKAFPKLRMIASTSRRVSDADTQALSARVDTRDAQVQTVAARLSGIVDRIGAGDAFAAGVLHALRAGQPLQRAADTGLALAVLKHALPGDAALFRQSDIDSYFEGDFDVRR